MKSQTIVMGVRHVPVLTLGDLRIAAMDPGVFAAASDYAKRYYPKTSLARAA